MRKYFPSSIAIKKKKKTVHIVILINYTGWNLTLFIHIEINIMKVHNYIMIYIFYLQILSKNV